MNLFKNIHFSLVMEYFINNINFINKSFTSEINYCFQLLIQNLLINI